jgi:hypothetical protein
MGLRTFLPVVFYYSFKPIRKSYITFQNKLSPITQFIQTRR